MLPRTRLAGLSHARIASRITRSPASLTNSPALAEILKPANDNTAARLAALPDAASRVRETFLAVHSRTPDAEEAAQAEAFLNARPDQPAEAVRDLQWALLTSAEFLTMP